MIAAVHLNGELLASLMFIVMLVLLICKGYPVAFTLGGVSLAFAAIGVMTGATWTTDFSFLANVNGRLMGTITNQILLAIPFFIFMGGVLEKSGLAEDLLTTIGQLFGGLRGGLSVAVVLVGALLAAATGVVGASVVAMGVISLPVMLRNKYSRSLSTGVIAASGTLGQIIPPSIVLIVLADQIQIAATTEKGVSIGDLFRAALVPGLALAALYAVYVSIVALVKPAAAPALHGDHRFQDAREAVRRVAFVMLPPLLLILVVLGSIFSGFASPTQAGAVGAVGAILLALLRKGFGGEMGLGEFRRFFVKMLSEVSFQTGQVCCMIMFLLIGAALFNIVFTELGGDEMVLRLLTNMPGGVVGALIVANLVIFVLGFFIDFFEITFIVVPLLAKVFCGAAGFGLDPVWFGVMIAINLQTSFLTPPFGFSLFYLKSVCPAEVKTTDIYRGVLPFIAIQAIVLAGVCAML